VSGLHRIPYRAEIVAVEKSPRSGIWEIVRLICLMDNTFGFKTHIATAVNKTSAPE